MSDIVERLKDAEIVTHALIGNIFQRAREEIERLRSKIAAMERQEPYAFAVVFPETSRVELVHDLDDLCEDMTNEAHEVRKLYLTSFQSQKENEND
jgi:hypothetical protein